VERLQKNSPQEKPPPVRVCSHGRASQDAGVVISQDAKSVGTCPSNGGARHGDHNGHGTAQNSHSRMVEPVRDITNPLRAQSGRGYATIARSSDYVGVSEAAGF